MHNNLLTQPAIRRLEDGKVTQADLAGARQALSEAKKLAEITAPGAPDSSHQFTAAPFSFVGPDAFNITVTGENVQGFRSEETSRNIGIFTSTRSGTTKVGMTRTDTYASATKSVEAATALVSAIRKVRWRRSRAFQTAFENRERPRLRVGCTAPNGVDVLRRRS